MACSALHMCLTLSAPPGLQEVHRASGCDPANFLTWRWPPYPISGPSPSMHQAEGLGLQLVELQVEGLEPAAGCLPPPPSGPPPLRLAVPHSWRVEPAACTTEAGCHWITDSELQQQWHKSNV